MSKVCDMVRVAITPVLDEMGVEIVDMTYDNGRKGISPALWIYIFSESGVDLELLEKVHRTVDPIIDAIDPTAGEAYTLNVSSPGLDRPFVSQRDFERNYGKEVELSLYAKKDGVKRFEGVLISRDDKETKIVVDGKEVTLENQAISKVNQAIKFE